MTIALMAVSVSVLLVWMLVTRIRNRSELESHAITPELLHARLGSDQDLLVVDVREPLDLLGNSVIIPGAMWLAPHAVLDDPSLIPSGKNVVVYCTCPTNKTSNAVLQRALATGFSRVQMLKGGLDNWRAKGYPVEPYDKPFRLGFPYDTEPPNAS